MHIEEEINPSPSVNITSLKDGNWPPKKKKEVYQEVESQLQKVHWQPQN